MQLEYNLKSLVEGNNGHDQKNLLHSPTIVRNAVWSSINF